MTDKVHACIVLSADDAPRRKGKAPAAPAAKREYGKEVKQLQLMCKQATIK